MIYIKSELFIIIKISQPWIRLYINRIKISMAKKVFSLNPGVYFGKQLGKGGRNEISLTLLGTL